MANSEKLLHTCRSALPFRPRVCYGVTLAADAAVTVLARRSPGGAVRHSSVGGLAGSDLSGGAAVGCLAVQESLTLWLNSPLVSRAKAEKILPALLDIQLPFALEDCLYQFVEFRRTTAGTISALVCAARRESIQACLNRYKAQGVDPMLLDHEGLALWTQSLLECPVPPSQYRVLVCLANDHATLVIGCGERYINAHSLQLPSPSAADAPLSVDDSLVNRLTLILHADLPSGVGVQWLFCGPRAGEPRGVDALHRALALIWLGPVTLIKDPASFLARALCTRALKCGPLRCNLRQHPFTHPLVQRAADRRACAAAIGILVAGILLLGFSLTSRLLGERRFDLVKSEIAAVSGELAPGVAIPYGREIPEVQKALDKQSPQIAPFLGVFTPSLAVRLAEVIKAGQVAAVRFETLTLRRNSLALTGVAADWDQCGQLEQRLKTMGYTVKLERQEAVAETDVRFTVNAEGGGP